MKVEWTEHAIRQRNQVADYIRWRFGFKHKKKFTQEVDQAVNMIMHNPNIGPIDPLFEDRPIAYRYVIINNLSTSRCGTRDMNLVPCPVVPCLVSIQYAV